MNDKDFILINDPKPLEQAKEIVKIIEKEHKRKAYKLFMLSLFPLAFRIGIRLSSGR